MNMDAILVHDTQGLRADWPPHHSLKRHPETLRWSFGISRRVDPAVDAVGSRCIQGLQINNPLEGGFHKQPS